MAAGQDLQLNVLLAPSDLHLQNSIERYSKKFTNIPQTVNVKKYV